VRELENLMTRAVVFTGSEHISADLIRGWLPVATFDPPAAHLPSAHERGIAVGGVSARETSMSMQDMERKLIEETLERFAGHRAKTAAALGIGVRTLSGKLKQYGYSPRAKMLAKIA
jgi:DNA-binding NtrC family response regulator